MPKGYRAPEPYNVAYWRSHALDRTKYTRGISAGRALKAAALSGCELPSITTFPKSVQ